jgi:hypothetical protein
MFALSMPHLVSADVTVNQQGYKFGDRSVALWTRTIQVKGLKMRADFRKGSQRAIRIYDLVAARRYLLDPAKKVAFELDLRKDRDVTKDQIDLKQLRRLIQATGNKDEINGIACDEYTFDLQVPIHYSLGFSILKHDFGTVCVSQSLQPGIEFTNFVREAIKRGFNVPAGICSPTEPGIGHLFYGDQPNVMVLSAKAMSDYLNNAGPGGFNQKIRIENDMAVASIQSDPIPDETFRVPADWKIKKQ